MKTLLGEDFFERKRIMLYIYMLLSCILTIALGKDVFMIGNLMILFGMVSFLFLKSEKSLLLFTIFISIFYEGISPLFNGTYIVMYSYILMLSFLVRKIKIKIHMPILILGLLTLFLSLAPLVVNWVSLPLLFISILKRFGFLIVFLFVINMTNVSEKYKKTLIIYIVILLLLNFSIALVQFAKGTYLSQDFITGFFGGGMTGIFTYILMFYIAILSGFHYQKKISSINYLILTIVPVVYSAIAEVKIGFITTAILLITYLVVINRSYKSFIYLVICGFIFVNLYSIFVKIYPAHDFFDKSFLEKYLVEQSYGDGETINRFSFISQINTIIFNNETEVFFGKGLGSGNSSEVDLLKGSLYNQYDYLKYRWFTVPYLYVETGIVGIILYIMIYIIPLIMSIEHFVKRKTTLSVILILMGLTNIIYLPYNSGLFHYGITTVYWMFMAFLVQEKRSLSGI